MRVHKAEPIDILRTSQKDEQFTDFYASHLSDILRLCGNEFRNKFSRYVHHLAQFFYYGLTSLSNFQTLGEEYTGVLRFSHSQNDIPNKWIQLFWLLLYIGGDNIYTKGLNYYEKKIKANSTLTPHARSTLLKSIQFLNSNKDMLIRFNQTSFYLNGKYYNVSNRLTGIEYIFLRDWMGDKSSTKALTVLGRVSLLYLTFAVYHRLSEEVQQSPADLSQDNLQESSCSSDECFLCAEVKIRASVLPCGHVFCWKCIFNTISYGAKCPVCRELIQPNRVILLQNY